MCLHRSTNLPEKITVREALGLFGAFYSRTVDADALLKRLTLWEKRGAFYGQLSGGQKQRVALALALLNDPQLLFLDEPSAGLDPQARLEIHELVSGLRKEQRSILLTTHYIEEAEKLCDRVAIVDEGRIVAIGSPHEIQARALGHSVIRISCGQPMPDGSGCPLARRRKARLQRRPPHPVPSRPLHPARTPGRPGEVDGRTRDRAFRRLSQAADSRRRLHRAHRKEPAGIAMRPYLALLRIDFKLAMRDRTVLFFNYLFPLIFFFAFAEMMGVNRGGGIANVVTMVLTIGILGNGLWGAGMRAVQEREMNILRRFKVTPISPAPILIASMVTGWLIYLPSVFLILFLARRIYGMPAPPNMFSLLALVSLGVFAFRSIGLILASIVNSTQESTIGIQLLYMPMLFP